MHMKWVYMSGNVELWYRTMCEDMSRFKATDEQSVHMNLHFPQFEVHL